MCPSRGAPGSRGVRDPGLRDNPPLMCHPDRSVRNSFRLASSRILQHRSGEIGGFTSDYKVHRLVYHEQHAVDC
jgi:hypothetical protein